MIELRRVAVTGLGIVSPLGNSVTEVWQAVRAGKSGIGPITRFDARLLNSQIAGEIKGFKAEDVVHKKEVKKYDLFSLYALAASDQAWNDAGLEATSYQPERSGCVLGVGGGGLVSFERNCLELEQEGPKHISPFSIPMLIPNLAAAAVAIRHGLRGVNMVTASACASGASRIELGRVELGR